MSRGRKPASYKALTNWEDIFWNSLPTYIGIINNYFKNTDCEMVEIGANLEKLSFTIPKGLNSKEIKTSGSYPVISQSKEYIIGYSDREDLLVKDDLPLIIFGDHSKTLKFVDMPFIIGADGVKLIKPNKTFDEWFFYYSLYGIITDTKNYGRHFGLLRKGVLPEIKNLKIQKSIAEFLYDLKTNSLLINKEYFNKKTEDEIISLQAILIDTNNISSELTRQLFLVKKVRQQLLQDAVEGKLVMQNPKDKPARELLKKIKAEKEKLIIAGKLKKEKELPVIKDEEIPFVIPYNWVWCRLGEISLSISTGPFGTMLHKSDYVENGIPMINPMNIVEEKIVPSSKMMVNEKTKQRLKNYVLKDGDVVIGRRGEMGRSAIVNKSEEGWLCGTGSFYLRLHQDIYRPYFIKILASNYAKSLLLGSSVGSTMNNLNHKILNNLPISLPPINEQVRIVHKLEQLLQCCNDLEESIKQSATQNEKLIQQLLRDALQSK